MVNGLGLARVDTELALAAAAAIHAAGRLCPGLLLSEAQLDFLVILDALGGRQDRHLGPGRGLDTLGESPSRLPGGFDGPVFRQLLAQQIFFYGDGRLLSRGHGVNGDGRTGKQVAAGKDAREAGLIGHRIGHHRPPPGQLDPFRAFQETAVDLLTDGRDNHVTFDVEFRTGNRDRSSSAGGVRLTQLHLDATQPGNFAAFGHDRHGRHQQLDLDALFLRRLNLMLGGRHLRLCSGGTASSPRRRPA